MGGGSGWQEGRGLLHASTVPAASQGELAATTASLHLAEGPPLLPTGALPQGRRSETASAQLTQWGLDTPWHRAEDGVRVASVGAVLCDALPLALRESGFPCETLHQAAGLSHHPSDKLDLSTHGLHSRTLSTN